MFIVKNPLSHGFQDNRTKQTSQGNIFKHSQVSTNKEQVKKPIAMG